MSEVWDLIKNMIDQVVKVHKKFGLNFFHIGADEVFNMGVCEESANLIKKEKGRERAMLWHITRTAKYIKDKYSVSFMSFKKL